MKGAKFNHSQRSWLVLWEAGVIVKLPLWVVVIYPSLLFYHFNIDVTGESLGYWKSSPLIGLDIKFVTTEGLECPTPENSKPLQAGDDEGRGSLVYFNEATMYQSQKQTLPPSKRPKRRGTQARRTTEKMSKRLFKIMLSSVGYSRINLVSQLSA
jgi:hypothetical protein